MSSGNPGSNHGSEPNETTTERSSTIGRPYQCDQCKLRFRRVDHLKRHVKLHSGQYKYQCLCGDTFSRNDVLARHLRRCEKGQREHELVVRRSSKQTRAKSACDRCANLKLKCDSQAPCRLCSLVSHSCEYTRQGYSDPYSCFRIRHEGDFSGSSDVASIWPEVEASMSISDDLASRTIPPMESSNSTTSHDLADNSLNCIASQGLPNEGIHSNDSVTHFGLPGAFGLGDRNGDFEFPSLFDFPFDTDALFDFPETMEYVDFGYTMVPQPYSNIDTRSSQIITLALQQPTDTRRVAGFSTKQVDPVEAKCLEIKELILHGEMSQANDSISTYITRENVITCTELYGKHFQPNVPILHRPTFDLTRTQPILLLAIMLVGACYSGDLIPAHHITKLAMRLLALIEQQRHETDMEMPPLSTIQACIILRPVLVLSRNEKANRYASLYFARIISMAKRCDLFSPANPIDYNMLTNSTFDWASWIEQETRRRVACQIFVQDMALCVFRRISPHFSPLTFKVHMPCYEGCWEAETASQCLEQLQVLPGHMTVAIAMQNIRSESLNGPSLFEVSAFGMTLLILGLHSLLLQATQNSFELSSDTNCIAVTPDNQTSDWMSRLHQAFADNSVNTLADELVIRHGSAMLRHINGALDIWRINWDLRNCQDFKQENLTLSSDPLRYWWLAKLYLVLHFYRYIIHDGSEFAILEAANGDEQGKTLETQLKILSWLSRFRRHSEDKMLSTECYLAGVVEPLDSGP